MKQVNYQVMDICIKKLIDDDQRSTWDDLLTEFGVETKQQFFNILHITPLQSIRYSVDRICKITNTPVDNFRELYLNELKKDH